MRLVISRTPVSGYVLLAVLFVACGTAPTSEVAHEPQTGEYTCKRLPETQRYQCLSIIQNRYVDPQAAGACDRINSVSETLTCVRIIVSKRFQEDAIHACDRINDVRFTNACLSTIANRAFDPERVKECDALTTADGTIQCLDFYQLPWPTVN